MRRMSTRKTSAAPQRTQGGSSSQVEATSAAPRRTQGGSSSQVEATPRKRRTPKVKLPTSKKTKSTHKVHAPPTHQVHTPPEPITQLPPPPAHQSSTILQPASQPRTPKVKLPTSKKTKSTHKVHAPPTHQVHTPPEPITQLPPPPAHQSRTWKMRLLSSRKTNNSAPQPNIQPPFASQSDLQPTHEFVHEHTSAATPELQSDSGEEQNEETEMQTEQSQPAAPKRTWCVDVIDDQGTKIRKRLRVNDVSFLSPTERIVLHWNNEGQPISDGGGLLNRFLGRVARDFEVFPLSYPSWKKIPKDHKEDVLKNTIQAKFEVESDLHISYVLKSLNIKWRERRQELWKQRDNGTRNRDQLIAMVPDGINEDHWASFVDYRLSSKTKEIAKKNKDNRKKQTIPHTGGSKSIARKKEEMELECGRKVSRGEVWTEIHKHSNGEFVNDEAREISEKIQAYQANTSLSQDISSQDSLAYALGSQEHCGRVRGLGLGPCPSQVFGHTARSYNGVSSPSHRELQNQVTELTSRLDEQNKILDGQNKKIEEQNKLFAAMFSFFAQNYQGQMPPNMAV